MDSAMPDVDGHPRPVQRVWVGLAIQAVPLTGCIGDGNAWDGVNGGGADP